MTLRYSTFDTFGTNQVDIEKSIIIELQNNYTEMVGRE